MISNSSDAIDKIYYRALTDDTLVFNKEDYFIKLTIDKENRTLTLTDTGIGMTQEELENNLGVIAKSGSWRSRRKMKPKTAITSSDNSGLVSTRHLWWRTS